MGTLRTIFAMAVVFAHAGVYMFVGALNGVQLFYMISGFLMSFILTDVKAYPRVKEFYINRFLRLYPVYAVIAILTLGAYAIGIHVYDEFFSVYREAPWSAVILLVFSNTFLFLQDWVMFAAVVDGRLVPTGNFMESSPLLYQGLLVPQAWTLGVELTFYLIAPFVLPRRRLVYVLFAASLALRVAFILRGFGRFDPWSYRFFPTELALFLAGALSLASDSAAVLSEDADPPIACGGSHGDGIAGGGRVDLSPVRLADAAQQPCSVRIVPRVDAVCVHLPEQQRAGQLDRRAELLDLYLPQTCHRDDDAVRRQPSTGAPNPVCLALRSGQPGLRGSLESPGRHPGRADQKSVQEEGRGHGSQASCR